MTSSEGSTGTGLRKPPPVCIVTGASGWLGHALIRALAQRSGRIRCLASTGSEASRLELRSPSVEVVVADVRDPAGLDRLFDDTNDATVFHAAAVIHPRHGTREVFDVNVGGTALVLDRARRFGARRVVYVSSNSPFGFNATTDEVFDEDSPYRPTGAYGRSKMEAELLVRRVADAGDVETVIVRCPWLYGPHQPRRQTEFFALVRRGLFPIFGDGTSRRSLVYTDNLAQGLLLAELTEAAAGRAYWIADAEPYRMTEIIDAVRNALASEGIETARPRVRLPSFVADAAELADRLIEDRGLYVQKLHVLGEMNKTIACSIARAERELGYRPEIALAEGMRRSIRWCLDWGEPL